MENPSAHLLRIIEALQEYIPKSFFVGGLGLVIKYEKGLASIKPLVNPKKADGTPLAMPNLHRVPLFFSGTDSGKVTGKVTPMKTLALVIHTDFNLEELIQGKTIKSVITQEPGRHLQSNAVALALSSGLFDETQGTNDSMDVQVKPGEKQTIGNGTVELWDIVFRLTDVVSKIVAGQGGTSPNPVETALLMNEINQIKKPKV